MNFFRLLPVIISILLLAAHYYRAGFMPLVFVVSASLLVLMVRQRWAVVIIQVLLFTGGIEWGRTLLKLVSARQSMGMPWTRLAVILGTVSAVSFGSIFLFRLKSLRERYEPGEEYPADSREHPGKETGDGR